MSNAVIHRPRETAARTTSAGVRRAVSTTAIFAVAVFGLLAATGCDDGSTEAPGAVSLQWSAGPLSACSDANLDRVEVHFKHGDQIAALHAFGCDDGGAFIDAVEPGRYDIAVRGIDEIGVYTFESVLEGVRVEPGERLDLGMVRMAARHAEVAVQWFFSNGRLCAQNHVDRVAVTIYDDAYYEVGAATFPCETGTGVLEPLPAGRYTLDLLGLTVGDDTSFARGVTEVELGRGDDALVEISLSMDAP